MATDSCASHVYYSVTTYIKANNALPKLSHKTPLRLEWHEKETIRLIQYAQACTAPKSTAGKANLAHVINTHKRELVYTRFEKRCIDCVTSRQSMCIRSKTHCQCAARWCICMYQTNAPDTLDTVSRNLTHRWHNSDKLNNASCHFAHDLHACCTSATLSFPQECELPKYHYCWQTYGVNQVGDPIHATACSNKCCHCNVVIISIFASNLNPRLQQSTR